MSRFVLNRTPAVSSGAGVISEVAQTVLAARDAARVLMVVDPVLQDLGIAASVEQLFRKQGVAINSSAPPPGEPKEAYVRDVAAHARRDDITVVFCLGGGSAIDAGKMIAAFMHAPGEIIDYRLAETALPPRRAFLIAAPTTAGTGAEATTTSILSGEDGVKYWYWSEELRPDHVLLDPELTTGLPPAITAATGADALVHAIEAATSRAATAASDVFALHAIELVRATLGEAIRAPEDLHARSDMQEAAYFAGLAIDNAGTGVAHAIGHALGSLCEIGHGRAVAIGLAASLEWSIAGQEDSYQNAARAFGLSDPRKMPAAFRRFTQEIKLDLTLNAPDLSAAELAQQIARPENSAMLNASRREIALSDVMLFAERTLQLNTVPA